MGRPICVLVSTWFSHVEARWDFPGFAYYLRRLASFSRLISFDKRGIGLSDPVALDRLPLLEEWMSDVRAVMDAAAVERAVVMGANEGSMMASLPAATYPERVSSLVLANATARQAWAPGSTLGASHPRDRRSNRRDSRSACGVTGVAFAAVNPTIAGDDQAVVQAWGRFLRLAASPSVAAAVIRMIFELDVPACRPSNNPCTRASCVPRREALFSAASGPCSRRSHSGSRVRRRSGYRLRARRLRRRRPAHRRGRGVRHGHPPRPRRRTTSSQRCSSPTSSTQPHRQRDIGDRGWRDASRLARGDSHVRRYETHGGRNRRFHRRWSPGDIQQSGARRALRARAAKSRSRPRRQASAGLHTGEIETAGWRRRRDRCAHRRARVMALAAADEVLVSRNREGPGRRLRAQVP